MAEPWAWTYYCKQYGTGQETLAATLREFAWRVRMEYYSFEDRRELAEILRDELAAAIGVNECTGLPGSESGSSGSSSSPSSPRSTPTAERADPASILGRLKAVEARLAEIESGGKLYDTVNEARISYRRALEKIADGSDLSVTTHIARAALGKEQP